MKKFLSLVMALAMTLTLVTVGASAKDFTDKSSINYNEAVSVVSGIGVVDGYTNGSFNPTNTLTRGAAAKIICNMILGPTTAGALGVNAAPFKDVPVSNVFAGYIAYCSQQGIINGYSDGTFKPAATVTGYQFMKMLLGALGYDGSIEGFTGANWTVAVAKLAVSTGLDKGNDNFAGSKAMTREEACLYAFNTLLADMVQYDSKGSSISINGVTIAQGASKAEPVTSTKDSNSIYDESPVTVANTTGDASTTYPDTVQFAEKYFPKLVLDAGQYAEGRTGRSFSYKGTTLCSFGSTDDLLASSTKGTELDKLTDSSDSHYIGYKGDAALSSVTILYNDGLADGVGSHETRANAIAAAAKKGVIVNFLDTNDNGKYDVISIVEKTVSKLSAAPKTTTSGSVTKVTISGSYSVVSGKDADDVVYPSDLAKDDVVLFYNSFNGTTYVEKAQSVTGTMTASSDSKVTVDGTAYSYTGLTNGKTFNGMVSEAKAKSTTYYLDNGGNVCYYTVGSDSVTLDNTLFVREAVQSGYIVTAKVVFMDGTTSTITVDKTATYGGSLKDVAPHVNGTGAVDVTSISADGQLGYNMFYTYTKTDAGSYDLTACHYQAAKTDAAIAKGTTALVNANGTAYATSSTAFILEKGSTTVVPGSNNDTFAAGTSYAVYTGVANTAAYAKSFMDADGVSSIDTNALTFVLYNSDGYALAVVGRHGLVNSSSASDYSVVMPMSGPVAVYKTNGDVDYYTYQAVVDGVVVDAYKTANTTTIPSRGTVYLVDSYDGTEANGTATSGEAAGMYPASAGIGSDISVSNGTMVIKDAAGNVKGAAALASDAQVFVYNYADKTVETLSPSNMTADLGTYYSVTTVATSKTDSSVKYVFVTVNDMSAATITLGATTKTLGTSVTDNQDITVAISNNGILTGVTSADNTKVTAAIVGGKLSISTKASFTSGNSVVLTITGVNADGTAVTSATLTVTQG